MQKYIGTKIVQVEEMGYEQFYLETGKNPLNKVVNETFGGILGEDEPGYKVIYEDGYVSWSPKEVFEKAYKEMPIKLTDQVNQLYADIESIAKFKEEWQKQIKEPSITDILQKLIVDCEGLKSNTNDSYDYAFNKGIRLCIMTIERTLEENK